MQKKLLTLAAVTMTAPAAVMAEAILYGRLNASIDYADVRHAPIIGNDANGNPYARYYADPNSVNPDGSLNQAPGGTIYTDANGNPIIRGGRAFTGWGVAGQGRYIPGAGRASRIGVKGSEDLGNGLKGIYQIELGLELGAQDNNVASGADRISYRNTFVGVAGDFGTALVGRHDTPLKLSTGRLDLFADTMADYNGTVGFDDVRADNAIAYVSPNFEGFSFSAAVVAGGGATAGSGVNIKEDSLAGAWSLAGIYNNGPFYASVAYESIGKEMFMDSDTSLAGDCIEPDGTPAAPCNYIGSSYDKWRIGLGLLNFNGFTLTGIWERQENLPAGQIRRPVTFIRPDGTVETSSYSPFKKQDLWQIQAAYAFGNNTVKAMYGSADRGDSRVLDRTRDTISLNNLESDLKGDRYTWAIGFDHNFSRRTKAYMLYTQVDDKLNGTPRYDGVEWDGFSVGLQHSF